MRHFTVAYAGAPQSRKKICAYTEKLAAQQFFTAAMHSNQIIVWSGFLGLKETVFTPGDDLVEDIAGAQKRKLDRLPPPPGPQGKPTFWSRFWNIAFKGRFYTWDWSDPSK